MTMVSSSAFNTKDVIIMHLKFIQVHSAEVASVCTHFHRLTVLRLTEVGLGDRQRLYVRGGRRSLPQTTVWLRALSRRTYDKVKVALDRRSADLIDRRSSGAPLRRHTYINSIARAYDDFGITSMSYTAVHIA